MQKKKLMSRLSPFLISSFLGLLISHQSEASSFYVAPYLGYRLGGYDLSTSSGNFESVGIGDYDFSVDGIEIGARVGLSQMGFALGAAFNYGSLGEDLDRSPVPLGGVNGKYKTSMLGLFLAYEFPVFIRTFATYYPMVKWDIDRQNLLFSSVDKLSGNAFSLGVGFTGLPLISIDLEYRVSRFSKLKVGSNSVSLPNSSRSKIDASEFILAVSVPLVL